MASPDSTKMTVADVVSLEDAKENPLRPGSTRSPKYFAMLEKRRRLPVMQGESFERFLDLYHNNQVVVVTADTGSGKSTQLTQRIMYLELKKDLQVVCTQPRRVAARGVAERVAVEMDVRLGDQVGVHHRDNNNTNAQTRLKFVPEGILLRQCQGDPLLSRYSCVIIDECHERTSDVDILLALIKKALGYRSGLKLVIMSATMKAHKFADYFGVSDIVEIQGRAFPVRIRHLLKPTPDYVQLALRVVKHIHETKAPGNILVFLASANQIELAVSKLRNAISDLHVVPLYSSLPKDEQAKAFCSSDKRMCIVATNVAQTSLTIDGVVYVVDGGIEMQEGYNPRVGMTTLLSAPISQASAQQRAGRAGRTQPGECFRLYTKDTFDNMLLKSTIPGLLKSDIKTQIMILKSAGFNNVGAFDFLDPPHAEVYLRGLQDLRAMNMIDSDGKITRAGTAAMQLPIAHAWYNAFAEALKLGCLDEMISIAALSSTRDSVFAKPHPQRYAAAVEHAQFAHPMSDHLSELNALYRYMHQGKLGDEKRAIWCHETFLNVKSLGEALMIRKDLLEKCCVLFRIRTAPILSFDDKEYDVKIRKALARGFYHHAAIIDDAAKDQYRTLDNFPVGVDPDSALVGMGWKWVVYHELGYTSYQYMDRCTVVELDWLLDIDHFYPVNLPKDYNGNVRNKKIRAIFDKIGRPYHPPSQQS